MKIRDFQLVDVIGMHRVQLYQRAQGESILVLLDGTTIGSIDRYEDFSRGHEIKLLDGSILTIQFANNQVFVFHNGHQLQAMPSITDVENALSPGQQSNIRSRNGFAAAGLVMGIISVCLLFLALKLLVSPPDAGVSVFLGMIATLFAILGMIFSLIRIREGKSVAGLVLSIIGLIPSGIMLLVLILYALIK